MTKPVIHKELEIHALGGHHDTVGHRMAQRQHAKERFTRRVKRRLMCEAHAADAGTET